MANAKYLNPPGRVEARGKILTLMGAVAAAFAIGIVADFEGYAPTAYLDPVGIPTICFGDTAGVSRADVSNGKTETFAQCVSRLNNQLYNHAKPVYDCVHGLEFMPDKLQAAFVSMAYNIGTNGFCSSSVARYANNGEWDAACARISEIYRKAGGRELPGLIKRRETESRYCLDGIREYRLRKGIGAAEGGQ